MSMTLEEVFALIKHLEMIFDIVKLVDAHVSTEYILDGDKLVEQPYHCYAVWNKKEKCENCISAKTLINKSKLTKFEFVGNKVYHVIAQYIEINDQPFVLEIVSQIKDDVIFSAYEQNRFVQTITAYNDKMYRDPLTKAYNRYYYKDFLYTSNFHNAIAIFDIDNFKIINDTYGHAVGDIVLKEAISKIQSYLNDNDIIIRYGGDEFLLLFLDVTMDEFHLRLETIRNCIEELVIENYHDIHISISIGGVFGSSNIQAIHQADQLLYVSKTNKNTIQLEKFKNE